MLRAENISYSVGSKKILSNISTDFLTGEFNVILGQNGSGKSTFLKIISGEQKGYSGKVKYHDCPLEHIKNNSLAKKRAVLSQQPELNFPLTVDEVVMMGRYPHFEFNPGKKDESICNEVIKKMNLLSFKERNYLTLSGGEKQRVQFARILAQIWETPKDGFRYLLLDEPLTNLDINYQLEFLSIAKELTDNSTVLVAILHDLNLALQFADKLFLLKDGELVANGNAATLLDITLVKQVFGVNSTIIRNPVSGTDLLVYH